jgi:hypothetical protein
MGVLHRDYARAIKPSDLKVFGDTALGSNLKLNSFSSTALTIKSIKKTLLKKQFYSKKERQFQHLEALPIC